jgi:hypothetical protein
MFIGKRRCRGGDDSMNRFPFSSFLDKTCLYVTGEKGSREGGCKTKILQFSQSIGQEMFICNRRKKGSREGGCKTKIHPFSQSVGQNVLRLKRKSAAGKGNARRKAKGTARLISYIFPVYTGQEC